MDSPINMSQADFDASIRYQDQDQTIQCHNDGREMELLRYMYNRPDIEKLRGNPDRVRRAIDEFGAEKRWMMNIGMSKGKVVTDLIEKHKPKVMVELGAYVGYSAILFGGALKAAGGQRYFSCELIPEYAAVTMMLVDLAGLSDVVKVVVGSSDQCLRRLYASGDLKHIDMLFLDHYKPAYKTDLKICEEFKLITPGTVLCADNVINPGNPPYLEYVRSTVEEKRKRAEGNSGDRQKDAGEFSGAKNVNDYKNHINGEQMESRGNPDLIYETEMFERVDPSGDKDGIEITHCVGVQA